MNQTVTYAPHCLDNSGHVRDWRVFRTTSTGTALPPVLAVVQAENAARRLCDLPDIGTGWGTWPDRLVKPGPLTVWKTPLGQPPADPNWFTAAAEAVLSGKAGYPYQIPPNLKAAEKPLEGGTSAAEPSLPPTTAEERLILATERQISLLLRIETAISAQHSLLESAVDLLARIDQRHAVSDQPPSTWQRCKEAAMREAAERYRAGKSFDREGDSTIG